MKRTVQDSTTRFSTSSFFKIKLEKVCKMRKCSLKSLCKYTTHDSPALDSLAHDSPGGYTLGRLTHRAVILWGD